ncbi:CoA ester lyase [Saccharopolyspora sp. HNM0983]|uniref:CoA ester lyase n=2 Tax=Saccharopolyspora montiporae TaxID=2781240 RepID=A0A929B4F8_9PSEU|nr:CoA ester lyase [Saccharopolyspora sp. HNM0983]MBE9372979.1 CoA ester lyase [Saccharopolyspora sp. HNM0983]
MRAPLFVPGERTDRLPSALASPADAVILDLEDSVAAAAKEPARRAVTDAVRSAPAGAHLLVRINGLDSPWFADDLAVLHPVLHRLAGVLLPKTAAATDVDELAAALPDGPSVVPIVESAGGVLEASRIAAARRVSQLLFGPADLGAELGVAVTPAGRELAHARSAVVLAAAAAGLARPLDGPHLALGDPDGLRTGCLAARELGFGGKAAIHPEQLPAVREVFAPSEQEVSWARTVLAAYRESSGPGAVRLDDGTFVDEPVARRAEQIIAEHSAAAS